MKISSSIKELLYALIKLFKKLLIACLCLFAILATIFFLLAIPHIWEDIQRAQQPTEIVEVPPGIIVVYLGIGGWSLLQNFVIINPPVFSDGEEWIRKYDRENPLDPEIVKKLLEKEKNLNKDKYTEAQKNDNRVAYMRTFYRESTITPRDWDGKQREDWYRYKEHVLMYTYGFVEGFDKVEWPANKDVGITKN